MIQVKTDNAKLLYSKKKFFFFFGGGGGESVGGSGSGWGVRVDVNEELKFL